MEKRALYETIVTHIISNIEWSKNMSTTFINLIIYVNKKKNIFFIEKIFPIVLKNFIA